VGPRPRRRAAALRVLALGAALAALAAGTSGAASAATGTKVTLQPSEFGRMIWGPGKQAVYGFSRDGRGRPTCYGKCAEEWPPLLTRAKPVAGGGVRPGLLGTVRRRGGALQVTYGGHPLYAYGNEGPNEVLCHDVRLNGGLWWVIGRDGKRRP
jgi:predicted lipoprotein with Yx(FWY)xxD motif